MAHTVPGRKPLRPSQRDSTAQFACSTDERFSFCLHVPRGYDENHDEKWPLVVVLHGTLRESQALRDRFAKFAEAHRAIVLSPLFPAGIGNPEDVDNYKFIEYRDIRFDLVLLAMIEQVSQRYSSAADRVLLFGFSGGGQFVHRFLYLHPRRLRAVSIGAPGLVTLLDSDQPWWVGTGGLAEAFGNELDMPAIRDVKIQLIVGDADIDTDIQVEPSSRLYMPGINAAGATRIERLHALGASFERHGVGFRFDLVPGVSHDSGEDLLLLRVHEFFAAVLAGADTGV